MRGFVLVGGAGVLYWLLGHEVERLRVAVAIGAALCVLLAQQHDGLSAHVSELEREARERLPTGWP